MFKDKWAEADGILEEWAGIPWLSLQQRLWRNLDRSRLPTHDLPTWQGLIVIDDATNLVW